VRRGFKGLTEVGALTDAQCDDLVLGNWHKLNAVLRCKPERLELQRLLFLELKLRGKGARRNFLERLRSAIAAARSSESRDALTNVMKDLRDGETPTKSTLTELGLGTEYAEAFLDHLKHGSKKQ
jgi:hypothetical protein